MRKILVSVMLAAAWLASCSEDGPTGCGPDSPLASGVPDSVKVYVTGSNLLYNEMQLGTGRRYWVQLEDERQYRHDTCVVWYDGEKVIGRGAQITYEAATAGNHTIKYVVDGAYSRTGREQKGEAKVKAFSAKGLYLLNEPNMTATEEMRSINRHLFGEGTVTRHVTGDYTMFGTTNQHLVNWAGHLYTIATYTDQGVAFSQFKEDGTFVKAVAKLPNGEQGRAFAGIDEQRGVVTTAEHAYLVDLATFTVEETPLRASEASANVLAADGRLFLIAGGKALAYPVEGLDASTQPVLLGNATAGFVQSKDGHVWAANGNTFLRIDPRDLTTEVLEIPEGKTIKFSSAPWKQCSWVASGKENAFFFTLDGGLGTASEVVKYDIGNGTLDTQFVTREEVDNYMIYATALLYDAERDQVVCSAIKGYGPDSSLNALFFFDGKTGERTSAVRYEEGDGSSDLPFPGMMALMKN